MKNIPITFEQRPTSSLPCGCDVALKKYMKDHHTNLQVSFLLMPEVDAMLAIQMMEKLTPDEINDQIDTLQMFQYDFNSLYQILYHALEVFTPKEMLSMLEIKYNHRDHIKDSK